MRKIAVGFLFLHFSFRPLSLFAQTYTPGEAVQVLKAEQESFLHYLNYISFDSNIISRLNRFIKPEVDSIQHFIINDTVLSDVEKVKAIQSLLNFLRELGDYIVTQRLDIYHIPDAVESFKRILKALLYHRSFFEVLVPMGPQRSQLMAAAFWQYDECAFFDDISIYKQVASSPANILQFLEKYPGFRYADSLLIIAAAHEPLKMASFLLKDNPGIQDNIRNNKNIYLQQIVSLAGDRNASELLPFIIPLAEKRITTEEILEKRRNVTDYFQLLVNTLRDEMDNPKDSSFIFQAGLRNAIMEKSLYFYVNQLNELHNSPNSIRFASVTGLRPEDIYYIITSCEHELYTSSYLGLYRQMIEYFGHQFADSIFHLVKYDNFRIFMRMAANYNTLADFLSCMQQGRAEELLNRFISGIESDIDSGLEKAMDIADGYTGLGSNNGIGRMIRNELQSNLGRCQSGQLYFGFRLYSILLQVFDMVSHKDSVNKLSTGPDHHEILKREALQNEEGEINELVLFYGDEDGIASFNNFLQVFADERKWQITKGDFWVTIHSLTGQPIIIYANLPLDNKLGMDMQAQDSLSEFFKLQSVEPAILIHRGHSYHLSKTLIRMQPSVKLAILGSCGGQNNILSVAHISPDAQIIFSKKTGSKFINDPIIDVINETLQNKRDLLWTDIWEELAIRFSEDEFALNLFNEYIQPSKNVSLFVLKFFSFYRL